MLGEPLLEREDELEALGAALDGRAALVTIEGEAGIGKTALLDVARALARERGMRVPAAHGGVLEQEVGYGVVRQLLEPAVLDAPELFAGPARLAAPVFGLPAADEVAERAADVGPGVQHALFRLVANLAARKPVLVSVDDAQWADEASLGWLIYLARRLSGLDVAIVVAWRVGEPSPLLEELAGVPGAIRLAPHALSERATGELAAEAYGAAAGPAFVHAAWQASGGNPFLLRELLGTLPEPSVEAVRDLPPAAVISHVTRRLARLSAAAVELARAVAVLDGDAELRHAVALAGLPLPAGERAADELTIARLLGTGRPLRFAHPLLRAAVQAEIPPARRAAAHRLAAAILDAELPDRAAAHLLACEPAGDAWVIDRLRAAAERALDRGAVEAAVRLLERARREPCEAPELRRALGHAHALAGRQAEAVEHLQAALSAWGDGAERDAIASALATALALDGRGAASSRVLEDAISALGPGDRERRLRLESELILSATGDVPVGKLAERGERLAREVGGESAAERALLVAVAVHAVRTVSRSGASAADMAAGALAAGPASARASETWLMGWAPLVLLAADRDQEAEHWLRRSAADAETSGSLVGMAMARTGMARVELFRGDLAAAEATARSLLDHVHASRHARFTVLAPLVTALVERGELEQAEVLMVDHGLDGPLPPLGSAGVFLGVRMTLRSAQGRHAEALADADELIARRERRGHRAPGLGSATALAVHAAGDPGRARALALEEVARAREWAVPSPLAIARRTLGQIGGDEAELEAAAGALEATPCCLELAKALVALGAARRRANRRAEAREPLRRALDLAARCGAQPLAELAGVELRACGARPRRELLTGAQSLTASERRVADLAAQGLSNPDVARALYVSRSTVESHLRAVYRKLGVAGRKELAAALESSPRPRDANADRAAGGLRA